MGLLTGMVLAAAAALAPDAGSAATGSLADRFSESIVESKMKRVGIVPRFIQREGGKETLAGSMGPQGEWLADELVDGLTDRAGGRFKVVAPKRMIQALKELKVTLDDLGTHEAQRKVADHVGGLDGLIVGRVEDSREAPAAGEILGRLKDVTVHCRLIDVRTGDVAGVAKQAIAATPEMRVYRGEANEVNRDALRTASHSGEKGRNVPDEAVPADGGAGREVLHPFEREEFPLPLWVTVDGKKRDFLVVRDPKTGRRELHAPIEPGEIYQIRTSNKLPSLVYMAVFVDGVNVLGKKRDIDDPKYWHVEPNRDSLISGWHTHKPGSETYIVEPFVVAPADDSVAVGENFRDELGMITILYFLPEGAAATPESKPPDGDPKTSPTDKPSGGGAGPSNGEKGGSPGKFATGTGVAEERKVTEYTGPKRGRFLAGFVIRYAPRSQIEKLPTVSP